MIYNGVAFSNVSRMIYASKDQQVKNFYHCDFCSFEDMVKFLSEKLDFSQEMIKSYLNYNGFDVQTFSYVKKNDS